MLRGSLVPSRKVIPDKAMPASITIAPPPSRNGLSTRTAPSSSKPDGFQPARVLPSNRLFQSAEAGAYGGSAGAHAPNSRVTKSVPRKQNTARRWTRCGAWYTRNSSRRFSPAGSGRKAPKNAIPFACHFPRILELVSRRFCLRHARIPVPPMAPCSAIRTVSSCAATAAGGSAAGEQTKIILRPSSDHAATVLRNHYLLPSY